VTFLLDTNVLSEPFRPRPDPRVLDWLAETDEDRLFASVISLAEIRQGVDLMDLGSRRARIEAWLTDDLPNRFAERLLGIDGAVANAWGVLMARARQSGIGLSAMDAFLAATADVHGLRLVTRTTADFERLGVVLLNPWLPQS
jgi:predicted nucleic acid-binding protein